jgi:hypothetical protein
MKRILKYKEQERKDLIKAIQKKVSGLSNEKLLELSHEQLSELGKKNFSRLQRVESFFYERPYIKVPLFFIFFALGIWIFDFWLGDYSGVFRDLGLLLTLMLSLYLTFFIVYLIRHSFKRLLIASNLGTLIISYVIFILCIIFLFSRAYVAVESSGKGYLTYGTCTDDYNVGMLKNDPQISQSYFYYSAVTFFTIGYGDICPMGFNKTVSIANGFVGNFVNVVLMVIVISSYLKRRDEPENGNGNGNDG